MRIVVTGASGYIGSHLIRMFGAEHEVLALSRSQCPKTEGNNKIRWVQGDIREPGFVQATLREADIVVHLAGIKGSDACSANVWTTAEINIVATRTLLEEALAARVEKFVFLSSYWVYGRHSIDELPCTEESELRPLDPYGMSKAFAEYLIEQSKLNYLVVRLSNVFGLGEGTVSKEIVHFMVESAFLRSAVEVYGDWEQTLDLVPVNETCQYIRRLSESAAVGRTTVNLASGRAVSVEGVACMVAQAFQELYRQKISIRHTSGKERPPSFSKAVSVAKLQGLVQSLPQIPLEDGIRNYVREYAKRFVK